MVVPHRTPSSALAGSPPVLRDVVVDVHLDGARSVAITGEFTGWSDGGIALREQGVGGRWRARLKLQPGEYQYRLKVDGRWADDPGASRRVANPFGGVNDVLVVA